MELRVAISTFDRAPVRIIASVNSSLPPGFRTRRQSLRTASRSLCDTSNHSRRWHRRSHRQTEEPSTHRRVRSNERSGVCRNGEVASVFNSVFVNINASYVGADGGCQMERAPTRTATDLKHLRLRCQPKKANETVELLCGHPTGLAEVGSIGLVTYLLGYLQRISRVVVIVKVYAGDHRARQLA